MAITSTIVNPADARFVDEPILELETFVLEICACVNRTTHQIRMSKVAFFIVVSFKLCISWWLF